MIIIVTEAVPELARYRGAELAWHRGPELARHMVPELARHRVPELARHRAAVDMVRTHMVVVHRDSAGMECGRGMVGMAVHTMEVAAAAVHTMEVAAAAVRTMEVAAAAVRTMEVAAAAVAVQLAESTASRSMPCCKSMCYHAGPFRFAILVAEAPPGAPWYAGSCGGRAARRTIADEQIAKGCHASLDPSTWAGLVVAEKEVNPRVVVKH